MPRFIWATDLHLDTATRTEFDRFCSELRRAAPGPLLLGGDTAEAPRLERSLRVLADRLERTIYFVLGNHDYYGSSVRAVRDQIDRLRHPGLHWLEGAAPAALGDGVALVGHGCWGDAREGDFDRSGVILSDYLAIEELARRFDPGTFRGSLGGQTALRTVLRELGDDAAATLRRSLEGLAETTRHVVVLTHVPPFRESCWHEGRISERDWLPGFTCRAVGDLLAAQARANPDRAFTVLCGHTHSPGFARILPNLAVHTGAGEYGKLMSRSVTVDQAGAVLE